MLKDRSSYKKLRLLCAWIGGFAIVIFSRINDDTFRIGVPFLIFGECIRIWSLGYMEKKGRTLAVSGPYSFVRNPLYWGNFLLGLGTVLTCNAIWAYFVFIAGFSIVYIGTIKAEEKDLENIFGTTYLNYRAHVPSFIPRLKSWRPPISDSFQWRRVFKHHEYITALGVAILIFGLYCYKKIVSEHDFDIKLEWAAFIVIMCALTLILERLFRKKLRSS